MSPSASGSGTAGPQPTPTGQNGGGGVPGTGQNTGVTIVKTGDVNGKTVLMDGNNRTLYVFAKDKTDGNGACDSTCVQPWPPLVQPVRAEGEVQGDQLGTFTRDDGTKQVTYYGMPLYYYSGDANPGEANGLQIQDWYLALPDGQMTK